MVFINLIFQYKYLFNNFSILEVYIDFNFIFSGTNQANYSFNPNNLSSVIDHANNSLIFSVSNNSIPHVVVPFIGINFNPQIGVLDITTFVPLPQNIIDGIDNLIQNSI